ncbi:MAG: hypothetical protein HKN82_06625 [Akkermansiaceae bacterium]|nr:hypothetical protein [Akkermansiaceae bacterium]
MNLAVLPLVQATPIIESIRLTFVTGDDNLRGDSGLSLFVESDPGASWVSVIPIFHYDPAPPAAPNWVRFNDHSIHTVEVGVGGLPLDEIRRIGITHVRPDADDQWKMDGIVAVGVTGSGEEYVLYANLELNFHFRRLNLYSGPDRVTEWRSPVVRYRGTSPADSYFDALNIYLKTGTDDLRRGSRVYVRIYFADGSIREIPLMDPANPDTEWGDHRGVNFSVALMRRYAYADVLQVRVRMEGDNSGGQHRDDWDLDGAWVDGFVATTAMERAARMAPNDRRPIAVRAPVQSPGSSHDPGHIKADGEVLVHSDGPLPTVSVFDQTQMRVTIATGGDDLRARSEVMVQLLRPDGSFFEHLVTAIAPEPTEWAPDSTNTRIINVPLEHRRETFVAYAVRFRASEVGGSGVDEWTLDGAEVEIFEPGGYRSLVATSLENHHFKESHTHLLDGIGSSSEPLEERPVITMPDSIWAEIPPIRSIVALPYFAAHAEIEGIAYPEWYEAFLSSREPDFDEGGADQEEMFGRYAFGLEDGERPQLHLAKLAPDPDTGRPLYSLVYKRMLNASGVRFSVQASAKMDHWVEIAPAAGDVHVLPDIVNGVEWCEVIVRGPAAEARKAHFRVQATPAP